MRVAVVQQPGSEVPQRHIGFTLGPRVVDVPDQPGPQSEGRRPPWTPGRLTLVSGAYWPRTHGNRRRQTLKVQLGLVRTDASQG